MGNLISGNYDSHLINIHSGVSGTVTSTFATPANNPYGLSMDGSGNLLISTLTGPKIYVMSAVTSTVTSSFAPPGTWGAEGVTLDPSGNLLATNEVDDKVFVCAGISGTVTSSFVAPGAACSGIAVETVSGDLLVANTLDPKRVYRQSGISATVLSSFMYTQANPKDITLDGSGNLLVADYADGKIYVMNGLSSIVTDSFLATTPFGLTMGSEGGC